MVTIGELREFILSLPEEFDNYPVINGEYIPIDDEHYGRVDKPVVFLTVDEETEELCILNQSEDEISDFILDEPEDD